MDKTVDLNYSWEYGASFQASPELQTMVSGWYSNGTEIVFACGGSMFQSVAAAASAEDGKVVGVDVDQSSESETVVTSAMKGLSDAAEWAIAKVYDGTLAEIGGAATSLGVAENAVGLPTATWSMENFSVADYEDLFQKVLNGDITIDNNSEMADPSDRRPEQRQRQLHRRLIPNSAYIKRTEDFGLPFFFTFLTGKDMRKPFAFHRKT